MSLVGSVAYDKYSNGREDCKGLFVSFVVQVGVIGEDTRQPPQQEVHSRATPMPPGTACHICEDARHVNISDIRPDHAETDVYFLQI